jgi:hypothetical protein
VGGGRDYTVGKYIGASCAYQVNLEAGAGSLVVKAG